MHARCAPLAMALSILATGAVAEESVFSVDAAASRVTFLLDATGHKVHGALAIASGEVRFDPAAGTLRGRIVVDATSGDTDKKKRDKKMHRAVLLSEQHPEILFEPSSFRGTLDPSSGSRLDVLGTLTLLGSPHPVEVPVEVTADGDRVLARAELTVPYVEWGLEDPSFFVLRVAKTVDVAIELVGTMRPPAAAAP